MNTITIDKNILLVEVPEDATKMNVIGQKLIFFEGDHPIYDLIELIPGNWQFIGTTESVTEEIAAKIVDYECKPNSFTSFRYRNYEWNWGLPQFFPTALESYQSWLRANKIPNDKRFAILKQSV